MDSIVRPEILGEVAATAARIDALGWGEATAGNISLLLTAEALTAPFSASGPLSAIPLPGEEAWPADRYLLITGTGTRMREIAADPSAGLCIIGRADDSGGAAFGPSAQSGALARLGVRSSTLAPSSELPVHLAAQRDRAPGSALVHTHPDFLIALSHLTELKAEGALSRALLPLMPEIRLFLGRGLKRLNFEMSGGQALAARSAAALREADILIWDRHGALAAGADLAQALDRLELAEKAARVWWIARRTGEVPRGLPESLFAQMQSKLEET